MCLGRGFSRARALLRSYIDYPFLGQTATPEVAVEDPYAVKDKN